MSKPAKFFSILMLTVSHLCSGRSQFELFSTSDAIPCMQICPSIYEPICGSDGKTYDNDCELENSGCELASDAPPLFKVANGECQEGTEPQCPESCPDVYRPVCGSDGNVYNNECDLIYAACQDSSIFKVSNDDCGKPSDTFSCSDVCPSVYRPVCGSDGNTYNNECELNLAACRDSSIYKLADIDCDGTVTSFAALQSPPTDPTPSEPSSLSGFSGPKESSIISFPAASSGLSSIPGPSALSGGDAANSAPPSAFTTSAPAPFTECPESCPDVYQPVCGSDGITYNSDCELNSVTCQNSSIYKVYNGECVKECADNCGDEFFPICGSDGKTYNNDCLLQLAICKNPQLTKASDGEC